MGSPVTPPESFLSSSLSGGSHCLLGLLQAVQPESDTACRLSAETKTAQAVTLLEKHQVITTTLRAFPLLPTLPLQVAQVLPSAVR